MPVRGRGTLGGWLLLLPLWTVGGSAATAAQPGSRDLLSFDSLVAAVGVPNAPLWPVGWTQLRLAGDRVTRYQVIDVAGRRGLCSESRDAASALIREVPADLAAYPILRFRLRVDDTVPGGDGRDRDADDFAARVFVNFKFESENEGFFSRIGHSVAERAQGRELPGRAINYVWGNVLPEGVRTFSPYSDRVAVVVVASGKPTSPAWRLFERDVAADFVEAFDRTPPPMHSVGVMTDSDNTNNAASACFAEISLAEVFGPVG